LKVTDLGFVTFMGGRHGDGLLGTFKGTFGYMAPEIGAK
jgi:serine/threonine-protein kinase Chk1